MLEARDAVGVLIDREVVKLLAVIVVGWWMIKTGSAMTARGTTPGILNLLSEVIGTATTLSGTALYYVGILALLVKVVYEAVVLAESR